MQNLVRQFGKFAVVGTIAFLIDFGTMTLLTEAFGVDYLLSTTIGFIVSVIFSYFASMKYVFMHKEGLSKQREFIIFVVLSVVGLLLNDLLMFAGVDLLFVDYRLMKILATMVVTIYNFVSRRAFLDAGSAKEDAFI